jgi:hypothetical protein
MSISLTTRKYVTCTKCLKSYTINMQKNQKYTTCYYCGGSAEAQ